MSDIRQQSFRNHASIDPVYHYVSLSILLANLILGIFILVLSVHKNLLISIWVVILSLVIFLLFFKLRLYPLKVQDRIIRLEERLRLSVVLPEPLKKRIPELSEDQLIALRFASDEELPALVELTLEKQLTRKQIKERIQNWRPDHFRI
jgi:cell division protein FtsL